jgi:UDP-glucuronate decarboxylase
MTDVRPKRTLVTGGAGFIGSHLCERLLDSGATVLCLDNFLTGSQQNIEHLLPHPRFKLLRHDVSAPLMLDVDEIYNLACPASPVHYQKDPVSTLKTCVLGALNALEIAHGNGARIVQASTSEVYGDPAQHPQPESYWGNVNPTGPRACYDEGKRAAETLFFDYRRRYSLPIKVARIFNTYGPRMLADDGRIVSNFIVQALRGDPITIYGDGSQTRAFCFVSDMTEGLIRLMASDDAITGPINLGNPEEYSVLEVARLVLRLTKSRSRIEMRPLPQDDPRRRKPEIAYAADVLAWSPTTGFEEGLKRTIDFFRRQPTANGSTSTFAGGSHGVAIALRPRQGRRAVAESLD